LRHGWRLNEDNHHAFVLLDAGKRNQIVAHYRGGGYLLEFPAGGSTTASASYAGDGTIDVELDGQRSRATVARRAGELTVFAGGGSYRLEFEKPVAIEEEDPSGRLVSPLPGSVIQVLVGSGETVAKGQALMIIEAMKMEHTISAPKRGTVRQIYFSKGEQVAEGAQLLEFEPEEVVKT
jgi:3-methylcrotonyl-CoA carboxylase alpha subunit